MRPLRPGDRLEPFWTLQRSVATTGTAIVLEAIADAGSLHTIKVLRDDARFAIERFEREPQLLAKISHPGVPLATFQGIGPGGLPFFVLPGPRPGHLGQRLAAGWSLGEFLHALTELLDILSAVHAAGLIHRDLCPENVLVSRSNAVQLQDFDFAHVSADPSAPPGSIFGSTAFMAPERARGELYDHRVDLFAVGAIIFTVLTGRPLHHATNLAEGLRLAATLPPPDLRRSARPVPPALAAFVTKALASHPSSRFARASRMREELLELSAQLDTATLATALSPIPLSGSRPSTLRPPPASVPPRG